MLRIAICDDEAEARDKLRIQLEKQTDDTQEKIVYEFTTGENAVKWIQKHPGEIDLLFLDVEMRGINGLEAAKEIRKFDSQIMITFVTGYTEYVFQGYQVNAMDYLVKPAGKEAVEEVLKRARDVLYKKEKEVYTFHNSDGTYRFELRDIFYFYSEKRLVYVVTEQREYGFYGKLDEVEEKLLHKFIRIHQRYLVNPHHVAHMGSQLVDINEKELPISRSLKEEATRKLALYLIGEG